MSTLKEELEKVNEFYEKNSVWPKDENGLLLRSPHYRPEPLETVFKDRPGSNTRLRLDWALANGLWGDGDKVNEDVRKLMTTQMELDLEDLLENGDVLNGTDALLKAMDGSKKRGKELKDVYIGNMVTVVHNRETDDKHGTRTDITTWLQVHGVWE